MVSGVSQDRIRQGCVVFLYLVAVAVVFGRRDEAALRYFLREVTFCLQNVLGEI